MLYQQYFAASAKRFAQKPWNFCELVFIEIRSEMSAQRWQGKRKQMGSIFHSELICSVASDYHQNNEMKDL